MKRNKIKTLRNKADRLWFKYLIERNPKCEVCGRPAVQVHHFFPKGRASLLRYDLENGISLCQGCHMKIHTSADPRVIKTIIERRGEDWYNRLLEKSKELRHSYKGVEYYQDIIDIFKELENNN